MQTIIYSHSDYCDVLQIQKDQMIHLQNKILFFNQGGQFLPYDIKKENFDNIIFYNDNLPYAARLESCLKRLSDEYILFTHENDIFLGYDESIIFQLVESMKLNNIDRIDLQSNDGYKEEGSKFIEIDREQPVAEWKTVDIKHLNKEKMYIGKHNVKGTYVYNVQPSLWKVSSFIDLMSRTKQSTYRSIEYDVEELCMSYNIYNLYCPTNLIKSGYNTCTNIYKYLHITKYGKFLPMNGSNRTIHGNSFEDVAVDYNNLIKKYNLKNSTRASV